MWVERKESKKSETYWKTTALLDDGTEAQGYGREFKVDDPVEVFFHYGQVKMQHGGKHEKKEERQTEG